MSSIPSTMNDESIDEYENVITVGTHVIVKKQSFSKVYKISENGTLMLGKNQKVEMHEIIGKPFWSTFEMVPANRDSKNTYSLRLVEQTESWDDLKGKLSGQDNRFITDDGTSQRLSKEEILQLQEAGKSGKEIISTLIENSTSFAAKTEYSQEKYIKKKERKYFRFLTICKPTIVSLHEIYFRQNPEKIGGLRMDALAQILCYSDVQADGLHMLYDSGCQGLPAAAMLNRIGENTNGYLIHLHPGNVPQITIVQAMNFPEELKNRHIAVNIYSFLRLHYQGESSVLDNISIPSKKFTDHVIKKTQDIKELIEKSNGKTKSDEISQIDSSKISDLETDTRENSTLSSCNTKNNANTLKGKLNELKETEISELETDTRENNTLSSCNTKNNADTLKRKLNELEETEEIIPVKKPKWFLETQRALDLLNNSKARGLTIIAREHPLNIINALLPFLGASRPFVIFHMYREPLQETYIELKQKRNVINVRLFTNFLRSYQILPDRTHPDILMNDSGGYILTGYLVQ